MKMSLLRNFTLTAAVTFALWVPPSLGQLKDWFGSPVHTPVPETPKELAIGDLNEDGFVDVALVVHSPVFGEGWIYTLLGDGSLHFVIDQVYEEPVTPPTRTVDVGHLNDDEYLDIVSGDIGEHEVRIRFNDGNGAFSELDAIPTSRGPFVVRIGDLDGDAYNDVVALARGRLNIIWGTIDGPVAPSDVYWFHLGGLDDCTWVEPEEGVLVDLTGDERVDVVFLATERNADPTECGPDERAVGLLRNLGNRKFEDVEWLLREPIDDNWKEWKDFAVVDLDDDEDLDVVISRLALLRTFLNDGTGVLEEDNGFGWQGAGEIIAVDDFNGDDTLDIAWSWDNVDTEIFRGIGDNEYSFLEALGVPLRDVHSVAIDEHPGPELIGFHEGVLTVVPNISYLEPASVDEALLDREMNLRVSPSIYDGGICGIYLTGADFPREQQLKLDIVDVAGRLRATLTPPVWPTRDHPLRWNGTDRSGELLPSGVYLVRLRRLPGVIGRVVVAR